MRNRAKMFAWISCILALATAAIGVYWKRMSANKSSLVFWISSPQTFDPMEHDLFVHHILQRPVLATMVSQYKSGEIIGVLAESWTVSDDKKVWRFKIRPDIHFEDGSPITPADVKRSLTRVAYLMKKNDSKSGLLEHLQGYEKLAAVSDDFEGIQVTGSTVTFTCVSEPSQFLEKLSFGVYSVVHENDYDKSNGKWKNAQRVTSSGPYKSVSWGGERIELKLRSDFPSTIYPNKKFEDVTITWSPKDKADVYFGDSLSAPMRDGLNFWGGVQNQIIYLRAVSWKEKTSLFYDKAARTVLRDLFYNRLTESGFSPTLSFLPLAVSGIKEFHPGHIQDSTYPEALIRFADSRSKAGWRLKSMSALEIASKELGIKLTSVPFVSETYRDHTNPDFNKFDYDIVPSRTGVLIEQPLDDLRFMVMSKEGIRLPDPTGRLRALVSQPTFSPQAMNEILWDDALVWPISHSASGLWIDESRVDFSLLNSTQPPTEMALIQPR